MQAVEKTGAMGDKILAKERFYWLKVLLDGLFLLAAFAGVHWQKRGSLALDDNFKRFLPLLFASWFVITVFSRKFKGRSPQDFFARLRPYWQSAIVFIAFLTLLVYLLGWINLSRFIIYGTISVYIILESLYLAFQTLLLRARQPGHRVPFALFFFLLELAALSTAFFAIYFSKRETFHLEEKYQVALMGLFFVWLLVSLLIHRFQIESRRGLVSAFVPFWQSEALILGLVSFMVFVAARGAMSRLVVFGSVLGFAVFENIVVLTYYLVEQFRRADEDPAELLADELAHPQIMSPAMEEGEEPVFDKYGFQEMKDSQEILKQKLERLLLKKFQDVFDFLKKFVDLNRFDILSSAFMFAGDTENIEVMEDDSIGFFFNFEKVNNFRYGNRVFIALNRKLKQGGVLVGSFESLDQRKQRIFKRFPGWLARIYYVIDFIYKRIMPKLPVLKSVYFFFSRGKKRVFSRTEVLGRLYYCGFEVIGLRPISGQYYFIAKKVKEPRTDPRPSYGPIFRQRRLGHGGRIIYIYKLRTMHPFAEYLHQYIFEKNKLEDSGKIKGDFRITSWGRFFRKTWIDELPMLVNWLKRDIKLVGVRPLSETFFETYPEELRKERVKYRPGLIPPFYADMPQGIEQVWESEWTYLKKYRAHPIRTDITYFFRAMNNILFHHAKSS
jgi:lipopolysaccharide/colanic/teichoic acid biosynthesis glycosyltransferase